MAHVEAAVHDYFRGFALGERLASQPGGDGVVWGAAAVLAAVVIVAASTSTRTGAL